MEKRNTLIFEISDKCNDNCNFCFNAEYLKEIGEMTVDEIRKNFLFAQKKIKSERITISGGEPTLHSDFWRVMNFFYNEIDPKIRVSLNTNSRILANKVFLRKASDFFRNVKRKRKVLSLSLSNVNHFPPSGREKEKIIGFANAFKLAFDCNMGLIVIILITKHNYKILPELARFINKLRLKNNDKKIFIHIRGAYVTKMPERQKKEIIPKFEKIYPYVEKSIELLLKKENNAIHLYNMPPCYFLGSKFLAKLLTHMHVLPGNDVRWPFNSQRQFEKVKPISFEARNGQLPECKGCSLDCLCQRINVEFIEKYGYPSPKPF